MEDIRYIHCTLSATHKDAFFLSTSSASLIS